MFFVVTGIGEQGAMAVTCETAAAAVEKARALGIEGARDVLIADADGVQHAPADFDRLFVAAAPETAPIP
jgi:protein-L-isoaspartate O-methyltransferase